MALIDPNSVGTDKTFPNPDDAVKQATGTYKDAAEAIPQDQKISYMPSAPDPKPFVLKGGGR